MTHTPRRSPRLSNDPNRYLRSRGSRIEAWPYRDGRRFYLGSFPTWEQARAAVREWQAGRLEPRPKGIRIVHRSTGTWYRVDLVLPDGGEVLLVVATLSEAEDLVEDLAARLGARPAA